MENNENIKDTTSANTEPSVTAGKDPSLDVSSLLKASKENTTAPDTTKKSPLELAKEAKENGGLGMVVDNKELEEGSKPKKLITNNAEHEAMEEVDEYMAEQDMHIKAA